MAVEKNAGRTEIEREYYLQTEQNSNYDNVTIKTENRPDQK